MYCFTVTLGSDPVRGIRIEMDGRLPIPVITVGGSKAGTTMPISQEWFERMVELDRQTLELPELKEAALNLPTIMNADIEEEETDEVDAQGLTLSKCRLISRPGDEKDRRALVFVTSPDGCARANYSGCYKLESFDGRSGKVNRAYPRLENVEGIEVLARQGGEALIVMHPNAAFRVTLPRSHYNPNLFMYRLTATGTRARLINLTPRKVLEAA